MSLAIICQMTRIGAPTAADPTIEAIERLLVGGIGLTALALAEATETADLTLAQWRVLVVVADTDGVRIGELATRLGVAVPSASRLVRRLERRGLVTAERAEDDRRATNVRLTDGGRQVRDLVLRRRRALVERATEDARSGVSAETIAALELLADALSRFG